MPAVDVVIVSWNVKERLLECLRSLTRARVASVVVVDNGSSDGTALAVRELFPKVNLVALDANVGFAAACNMGARHGSSEYLLFLNPDSLVPEEFIGSFTRTAVTHPQAGVLGGAITNPDSSIQPSVRSFPTTWVLILDSLKLLRVFPGLAKQYLCAGFDYAKAQQVEQVMGALFAVPRAAWQKLGGFDEAFFVWYEEVDFCKRALSAGYEVWYDPGFSVIHYQGASARKVSYVRRHSIYRASQLRYLAKHGTGYSYGLLWLMSLVFFPIAGILDAVHYAARKFTT